MKGVSATKVVIVHDYLNQRGGAEQVAGALHEIYPDAPLYTLFVDPDTLWPSLRNAHIVPSVLRHFPFVMKRFKLFFWLYPAVMRTIEVEPCDVVITSSSAYAKGVRLPARGGRKPVHICYCHTPMRFAWDFDRYIANETGHGSLRRLARLAVPWLKRWDIRTAARVDAFIANSSTVRDRIRASYGRDAFVVPPAVEAPAADMEDAAVLPGGGDPGSSYYLVVSRLVSYKGLDLAVRAFTEAGLNLFVIGSGPDRARLESLAGPGVQFLGWQSDETVRVYMVGCQALIFPGEEDFGITPVQANALGKPVIAYRAGGALDTVDPGVTGVFFTDRTVDSLLGAICEAAQIEWHAEQIWANARRFSRERFETGIRAVVEAVLAGDADASRGREIAAETQLLTDAADSEVGAVQTAEGGAWR